MGQGETGVGEAPSFHSIGQSGLPLRKKLAPKQGTKKLKAKKNWHKSFGKFSTKGKNVY